MQTLVSLLFLGSLGFAQRTSPATPPKGVQVNDIPILGFGTWQLQNTVNPAEAVADAIVQGYRHFDCAYIYQNQKAVGQGIKEGLKRTGLTRQDLWITGKLWNSK
jgi:alcohol dehydrogenase (NADP+)